MKSNQFTIIFIVLSAAFLILAGAIVYAIVGQKTEDKDAGYSYETQQTMGDKDATVHVVEFADFKCPGCKKWDENVLPQLKKDYVDTGKVQFHFINFPFMGEDSTLGAAAGEAIYKQDQDSFWTFYDALYAAQQSPEQEWITEELLVQLVEEKLPEVDVEQFKKDLNSKEIQDIVAADKQLALDEKVEGAPSIYVNGELVGASYDSLKKAIEEALKE